MRCIFHICNLVKYLQNKICRQLFAEFTKRLRTDIYGNRMINPFGDFGDSLFYDLRIAPYHTSEYIFLFSAAADKVLQWRSESDKLSGMIGNCNCTENQLCLFG